MAFPAEYADQSAPCPQCHAQTELLLAAPRAEASPFKTRAVIFLSLAVLILVGGLLGAQIALKRARRLTGAAVATIPAPAKPADPIAQAGFQVSPVTLEKATGSTLVHAVGTITEVAKRKRFGVRVELALFDRDGSACGWARDYQASLEPGEQWKYRAIVPNAQVVRARVANVTEEK